MRWFVCSLLALVAMSPVSPVRADKVLGDITIPRKGADSTNFMPAAIFPHWKHRLYFTCSTCHDKLFKMEAGADPITMDSISDGQYCGVCHNSKTAFEVGFNTCERCHRASSDNQ